MECLISISIEKESYLGYFTFGPGDSSVAIISADILCIYPFLPWPTTKNSREFVKYSSSKPYKLNSSDLINCDYIDCISFSDDSRYVSFSAVAVESDVGFVVIYDLFKDDLHWIYKISDHDFGRSLSVKIIQDHLYFENLGENTLYNLQLDTRQLKIATPDETARFKAVDDRGNIEKTLMYKQDEVGNEILERWIKNGLDIDTNKVIVFTENKQKNLLAIETECDDGSSIVWIHALSSYMPKLPSFFTKFEDEIIKSKNNGLRVSNQKEEGMVYKLEGNWQKGIAYDVHTLSSEYLGQDANGHDRFDTKRSEMGELVYQLKYRSDATVVTKIIDLIQKEVDFSKVDVVVTIPPSNQHRPKQPVTLIATEIGKRFGIDVYFDALTKSSGSQEVKSIIDPVERAEALRKTMHLTGKYDLSGKIVLLLDDLYRSGATLRVATELLNENAKVQRVYVLTMTKTRSNR